MFTGQWLQTVASCRFGTILKARFNGHRFSEKPRFSRQYCFDGTTVFSSNFLKQKLLPFSSSWGHNMLKPRVKPSAPWIEAERFFHFLLWINKIKKYRKLSAICWYTRVYNPVVWLESLNRGYWPNKTNELLQMSLSLSFWQANLALPENFNIAGKCAKTDFFAKSRF